MRGWSQVLYCSEYNSVLSPAEGSLVQSAETESTRQIAPSRLFDPQTFVRVCRDHDLLRSSQPQPDLSPETIRREFFASPVVCEMVGAAQQIEPAINPAMLRSAAVGSNLCELSRGRAYLSACEKVRGRKFTDVLLIDSAIASGDMRYLGELFGSLRARIPT
jgi:hypothetical protein